MIPLGNNNLANVKNGNNQITKIMVGNNLIWENWREYIGNAFNRQNTTLSWSTGTYDVVKSQWATIIYDDATVSTWSNFHTEYGYITFHDYNKVKVKEFKVTPHYASNEGNFITSCSIEVSQDGVTYHNITGGSVIGGTFTVNYDALGIDYVRYVRYSMNIQNSSYPQERTWHYTPSIVVSRYDKKGK